MRLLANITDVSNYPSAITEEDLANITTNLLPTTTQLVGTPASPLVGWLLDLKDETTDTFVGEKALADSAVFNNVVLFTTFTPPTTPLTADCVPNQGNGRVYAVNLFDGSPIKDLDQVGARLILDLIDTWTYYAAVFRRTWSSSSRR